MHSQAKITGIIDEKDEATEKLIAAAYAAIDGAIAGIESDVTALKSDVTALQEKREALVREIQSDTLRLNDVMIEIYRGIATRGGQPAPNSVVANQPIDYPGIKVKDNQTASSKKLSPTEKLLETENEMLRLEFAQDDIFGKVSQAVRNNVRKIIESINQLAKEYYDHADPMRIPLAEIIAQEIKIVRSYNLSQNALKAHDVQLAMEKWHAGNAGWDELGKRKTAYSAIAYNMSERIKLLKERLKLLGEHIAKINPSISSKAHETCTKWYDVSQNKIAGCLKREGEIASLKNIEGQLFVQVREKFHFIKDAMTNLNPDSGFEEYKKDEIQPLSLTRVSPAPSTSSGSKDSSPNGSPPHSPSSSPSGSPGRSKDSSPIHAAAKLSSSPHTVHGSASQAVQQQQKQKLVVQQQQPSTHFAAAR